MKSGFTVQRLTEEGWKVVAFERGEWVKAFISNGRFVEGEIAGISTANQQARIGAIWFNFGALYKAERPAEIKRQTVALSKCINRLNAKFGADLTDADRVPL